MFLILRKAWHGYLYLFHVLPDQRLITWPFVSKPYQVITLVALYLMIVLKWGPQWMKNRKPYNLNRVMIVYNLFQVIACAYCFHQVFFILRKKQNQASFLHVYHHAGMVVLIWSAVTFFPGGHSTFMGVVNSLVHVVMYSYYLLSVAVSSVKNSIWMKKLVTQIQIVQFLAIAVHSSTLIFAKECEFPRWHAAVLMPQCLFMLALFVNFYINTYFRTPKQHPGKCCSKANIVNDIKSSSKSDSQKAR